MAGSLAVRSTQPGWAQRRLRAARLARLLSPAALALGGFTSIELRIRLPAEGLCRPDVSVVLADPPVDGVADSAPALVIEFAPATRPWRWLEAGAAAVWVLGADNAHVYTVAAPVQTVAPPELLAVPGLPALTLPVALASPPPAGAAARTTSGAGPRRP